MVKEIRIYIEGGGDKKETKKAIRIGFSEFLKDLRQIAQKNRIRWQIIICGSRQNAFGDFKNALKANPNAFNVLLVDAEAPVNTTPCQHLKFRDDWDLPNTKKGEYHKIQHASKLLALLEVDKVRQVAPHCDRLFTTLLQKM
jgi:hypothetical protein